MQERIGRLEFSDAELLDIIEYCSCDASDTLELARLQLDEIAQLPGKMTALYFGLLQPHLLRVDAMTARGILFDQGSFELIRANQERLLLGMQARLKAEGFVGGFHGPREKLTVPGQNLDVVRTLRELHLDNILDARRPYKIDANKSPTEQRWTLGGIFKEGHKSPVPFIRIAKQYHDLIDLTGRDWTSFIDSDGRIRSSVVFPGSSSYRTQQLVPNPLMLPYYARPLFHAPPGRVLLEMDFKCQEIGLAAVVYGDDELLRIYNGFVKCLYCEIGNEMELYPCAPGKPADPKTDPDKRAVLKTAILALGYGGGTPTLMEKLGLSRGEARDIMRTFWRTFPKLREGREIYIEQVRQRHYAENVVGLIRAFRPFSTRNGEARDNTLSYQNFPVQSAGSVVLMETLARLPTCVEPVLTMHDALLLDAPSDGVLDVENAVRKAMEEALGALFPNLRCRYEARSAWRYHKDFPGSLHEFCQGLGLTLTAPMGS
jgi:hypothetical protein